MCSPVMSEWEKVELPNMNNMGMGKGRSLHPTPALQNHLKKSPEGQSMLYQAEPFPPHPSLPVCITSHPPPPCIPNCPEMSRQRRVLQEKLDSCSGQLEDQVRSLQEQLGRGLSPEHGGGDEA